MEVQMKQAWVLNSEGDVKQSRRVDPFYDHERSHYEYRRKMAFQQDIKLQVRNASISDVVPDLPAAVKSGSQLGRRVVRALVSITIAGMIASLAVVAVVLFVHLHDFTGNLQPPGMTEASSTDAEILLISSDATMASATPPLTTQTWSTETPTFIQYPSTQPTLPDCTEIPVAVCRDLLPYDSSFFPNRFNLSETITQGTQLYHQLAGDVLRDCRTEVVERLLCRIIFPPCFALRNFDNFHPLPCRSLCEDVLSRCVVNTSSSSSSSSIRIWGNLCTPMPESENESICFRNTSTSPLAADQHSPCSSVTCENGGICFHVNDRAICRCPRQFYGIHCQEKYDEPCDSHPCLNGGTCVSHRLVFGSATVLCLCQPGYEGIHCERGLSNIDSTSSQPSLPSNGGTIGDCRLIPSECRAVLPHNRSEGLVEASATPFFTSWSLLEAYVACSPSAAKVLICATAYPSGCVESGSTESWSREPSPLPCREVCYRMKRDCEYAFAVLNLHDIMCNFFQSSSESSTCLGMP
ncbi:uncharacterized protein [Diadema antillarum]|uniref:uncharacterized protein n=1 Tax=Diadema antillarum TaxID=105358 RepID=UPI003A8C4D02